jgi:nitroreductase
MNASELHRSLHWRYATKQFDPKLLISDENWKALEEAFVFCPSSYGLQPWKFLVVKNPEIRKKLREKSWNQSQVEEASHFVVLQYKAELDEAHIARYVDRMAEVQGTDRANLSRYEQMMVGDLLKGPKFAGIESWAKNQVYIAMGFLLQAAASLGVDACPFEGLDPVAYDEILNSAGSGYKTAVAIAFGYRAPTDRYHAMKKVRFPQDQVIEYR